jgi:hypothetical protein
MCINRIKYSSINNSDNDNDQPFVNALPRKRSERVYIIHITIITPSHFLFQQIVNIQ